MRVDVVTIFPDYYAPLELSLIGRARRTGLLDIAVHDLRDHAVDVHRTVDDAPYGGGPGMVMQAEPWGRALDAVLATGPVASVGSRDRLRSGPAHDRPLLVVPTPAGTPFDQVTARRWSEEPWLVFAAGRYEGIDARVLHDAARSMRVVECSLGDYVLAGGDVAILVVVEAVTRLLPGVLGNPGSLVEESHAAGVLEAPTYTRPARWRGLDVPPVLLSGDHAAVARWRRAEGLRRTAQRRPDLLAVVDPSTWDEEDRRVLAEEGVLVGRVDSGAPVTPGVAG
ncbi:MAG: tRNA (guanosine(37)-N1)-methyltransferase TrmD [Actinomycetes bacterium]